MNTSIGNFSSDLIILILRLSIAALMLTHGLPKLSKLLAGGEIQFADPIGLGSTLSLVLVVFSEVLCSAFIAIGYKTKLATLPLIFTMLVAAFIIHINDGIYKQEKAILYILVYLSFLITGSGRFSIDYFKKK